MQDFKRLKVWHKAHALLLACHEAFTPDRGRRISGLRAQAVSSAASISANIAEGCAKSSEKEFARFLEIAGASARELENHLLVARDLEVLSHPQFESLDAQLTEVRRMLIGLMRAVRHPPPSDCSESA